MEAIKSWVVNIAGVAVLMILLDLIMPEGRIRKFTRLLTGFILMFVMINPVLQWMGKGVPVSFAGWSDETFLWSSQVKNISSNMEEERSKQTLELYRSMLLTDIQKRLESHDLIRRAEVDVVINENHESEKFGEIRKLYINLVFPQNSLYDDRTIVTAQIQQELQQVFLLRENDIVIDVSDAE